MYFDFGKLCYGGDYNPEQWIDTPEIWEEDIRLMKLAGVNAVSLGIFAWTSLEPRDGVYDFRWMDTMIEKLYSNGISVVLATPSGARPAWMSRKYPEVLRVNEREQRALHGNRHNHCWSSPVYREKTAQINRELSKRYGKHPAVILWHISNEYGGECHCPRCKAAFREWLKERYQGDLHALNHAWWTAFWSHTYTDWEEIDPPSSLGETSVHGLTLDWKRFVTEQTIDFFKMEVAAVREYSDRPVTTNMMQNQDTDYCRLAKEVDLVTWDNYPNWHSAPTEDIAARAAFFHDRFRSVKKKPFLMLESTPSMTNWKDINKLERPGLNTLASLQAVAHGSDGVMYFQWRKSRGAFEKFHGALVDHEGTERTRVFQEAARIGEILKKIPQIKDATVPAKAAVIWDYENGWAIHNSCGMHKNKKDYLETCIHYYEGLWKLGIPVDVLDKEDDLSGYSLVIAPMLYMMTETCAEHIRRFVEEGGTFLATYMTAYVGESDLCHLGGFPGLIKDVMGIWNEEIDTLFEEDRNFLIYNGKTYSIRDLCEIIHLQGAEALAVYGEDFYQGTPVVTVNSFGKGKAYYVAARTEDAFIEDFLEKIVDSCGLEREIRSVSKKVSVEIREKQGETYVFVMNFSESQGSAVLEREYENLLTGERVQGDILLKPYECLLLKR